MSTAQQQQHQSNNQQQSRESMLGWHDRRTTDARLLRQAYGVRGFELVNTGGDCTAFQMTIQEGTSEDRGLTFCLVAQYDGLAPADPFRSVVCGLIGHEHSEFLTVRTFRTSRAFFGEFDRVQGDVKRFFEDDLNLLAELADLIEKCEQVSTC